MTRRKGFAIGIAAAVLLIVCAACLAYCKPAGQAGDDNARPLLDILRDDGYEGTLDDWADSLNDEQKAAIDISYESSTASGFTGTKEEWLSKELAAHHDSNGALVVSLPDGGEFTIPSKAKAIAGESEAEAGAKSNSGSASATSSSSSNETAGSDDSPRTADSRQAEASEDQSVDENGEGASQTPPTSEARAAALAVDSVRAHAGEDNLPISVKVENNPGILGLTLSLSYDDSVLTLVNAESGEVFMDDLTFTHSPVYEPGCVFTWDGVELASEGAEDGTILTLYFKVANDAEKGNYPVVVHGGDSAITGSLEETELTVQNGSVTIE